MIRITRTALPAGLSGYLAALTEQLADTPLDQRATAARGLWRRKSTRDRVHQPLGSALRQMAPGLERCMYCGDNQGTDIDHFEPLARNPLRTFDWLNHLLACALCNSHKKRDRFPLDADGQPLLIDPTAEDPFDHLVLTLSFGEYVPLTDKGRTTIEVCDLNRPLLKRGRVNARTSVESCLLRWIAARRENDAAEMSSMLRTVREQPCADVCQAMLLQALGPLAEIVFADTPEVLAILRLPDLRDGLLR